MSASYQFFNATLMKKRLLSSIVLALIMVTTLVVPVFAISDPTTAPAVNAVYVYNFDDGSAGVLVDYYLDYTVVPPEVVTEAYSVVFIDNDGTTQLKSVAPYTFQNSGYDRGLAYIPFSVNEVVAYGLSSANITLYRVWLTGNPTLSWVSKSDNVTPIDPPKTIASIDQWNTTGDMAVLLALRVLYYADALELAWSLNMIETTSIGSRLTTLGEAYFENVIPNLRALAPACFSASSLLPTLEKIDYTSSFGAVLTNGTGTAQFAPINLLEGNNNVNVTTLGTFIITLNQGTRGNALSNVCTVTGGNVTLVAGINTITTTTLIGNILVSVNQVDTTTAARDTVVGTGWDLTDLGLVFGMSRWMISGIVWIILSVIICAASLKAPTAGIPGFGVGGSEKTVMIVFNICIVIGILLGLLKPIVGVLMFIGFGIFTGYVLFFRGANV